jgi:hypothetical protein
MDNTKAGNTITPEYAGRLSIIVEVGGYLAHTNTCLKAK